MSLIKMAVKNSLAAVACSMVLMGTAAARADERARVTFDIGAQSLAAALSEFARQSQQPILFAPDVVANKTSSGVQGNLDALEGLKQLLRDTGLTFSLTKNGAVLIGEPRASVMGAQEMRVAQADTAPLKATQQPPEAAPASDQKLEEIVVTGTHIRGHENPTAAVKVLDRKYIESTGMSTTTRLIESLPQNFALASQSATTNTPGLTNDIAQGSSINLRGVGEGTTLVLLNGHRMAPGHLGSAVDISALPLSAIERVEVLTDGASALYGSDAVGGVVNFVLRRDYRGAETSLRAGESPGGVNEYRASQLFGQGWNSGHAVIAGEYYKRDLLRARERDFVPSTSLIGSLLPEDKNYSVMLSARQELSDQVGVFSDALYTHRDSFNAGRVGTAFGTVLNEGARLGNAQLSATLGLDWTFGNDWQVELSGSHARNDRDAKVQFSADAPARPLTSLFKIRAADIKGDGPLLELPGGAARVALGASWRAESLDFHGGGLPIAKDQRVNSAFAELSVPVIGNANTKAGARRLELSLAGRYDDYSSFGSSIDPRVGIAWEPASGLRLRGSYGTSYVAPRLPDYDSSNNFSAALFDVDPDAPGGVSYQLQTGGVDSDSLVAQESESYSLGLDLRPARVPGLKIGLNYYDIRYRGQITGLPPSTAIILGDPQAFGSLIIRDPSEEEVERFVAVGLPGQGFFPFNADFTPNTSFTADSVDVIVDFRRRNLASVQTRGMDASLEQAFSTSVGEWRATFDGTYIFERVQQVTSGSTPFETIDTIYNPPELRMRASLGWQRGGWASNLFVNYTDSYIDNRLDPVVAVASNTTVDANISYQFGDERGALSGVALSLNGQNVFDRDPPPTHIILVGAFEMGFDPTNASPLGRLIALEVSKRWQKAR